MNEIELRTQIKELRDELETRYKYGTVKIAAADGTPVPTETLQNQMYGLIYKLSKVLRERDEESK